MHALEYGMVFYARLAPGNVFETFTLNYYRLAYKFIIPRLVLKILLVVCRMCVEWIYKIVEVYFRMMCELHDHNPDFTLIDECLCVHLREFIEIRHDGFH